MPRPYALKDADVPDKTAHEIEINESSQLQGSELLSSSLAPSFKNRRASTGGKRHGRPTGPARR